MQSIRLLLAGFALFFMLIAVALQISTQPTTEKTIIYSVLTGVIALIFIGWLWVVLFYFSPEIEKLKNRKK